MRVIHVLRKPLSEGTVAANVLKHGCGGINIDASRIGSSTRTNASKAVKGNREVLGPSSGGGGFAHGTETVVHNHGRWPANVILQHLDGCRCEGIKKVKGSNNTTGVWGGRSKETVYDGGWIDPDQQRAGYTDKDGKESVANWVCEPGCPVARLDEQSGSSVSAVRKGGVGEHLDPTREGWRFKRAEGGFTDSGGVSRFFKQVGGKTDG